jgi:hypothetical protein
LPNTFSIASNEMSLSARALIWQATVPNPAKLLFNCMRKRKRAIVLTFCHFVSVLMHCAFDGRRDAITDINNVN